jgi:hypothetical protein
MPIGNVLIGNGKRFNVTLGGNVTKGDIFAPVAGGVQAGVYMKTGVTGAVVPVAIEGVFKVATATTAGATKKFVVGDAVYAVISGGAITNAQATGSAVPLGMCIGPATTSAAGAESCYVKLCAFGKPA